jgi:hypothetical protein
MFLNPPAFSSTAAPDGLKRTDAEGMQRVLAAYRHWSNSGYLAPTYSSGVNYSRPDSAPTKSPRLSIKLCRYTPDFHNNHSRIGHAA